MDGLLKAFRPFPGNPNNGGGAAKSGSSAVGLDDNSSIKSKLQQGPRAASPTKGIASQLKEGNSKYRSPGVKARGSATASNSNNSNTANYHNGVKKDPAKPYYVEGENEDKLDLQYKSLKYMFQRTNIASTEGFAKDVTVGGVGVAGAGGSDRYREQAQKEQMKKELLKREYQKHQAELREEFEKATGSELNDKDGDLDTQSKLGAVLDKFDELKLNNGQQRFPDGTIEEEDENESEGGNSDADSFIYHFTRLSDAAKKKLDIMYNRPAFDKALSNDKHRVLIDWRKNKFRALCILSGIPPSIEDKLTEYEITRSALTEQNFKPINGCKPKVRRSPLEVAPGYSFLVLPATSSERIYVETLTNSGLYAEHYLSEDTRRKLAKEALMLAKRTRAMAAVQAKARATGRSVPLGPNGLPAVSATQVASISTGIFTRNDRSLIVTTFLRKLAFEVQVDRLYKALYKERIKKFEKEKGYGQDLLSSTEHTPEPYSNFHGTGSNTNLSLGSLRSSNFVVANGVSVSLKAQNYSQEEKYYMKKPGAPEIPYSHKPSSSTNSSSNNGNIPSAPTLGNSAITKTQHSSPIVYAKNVPTTKPRGAPGYSGTISRLGSSAGSRSTSPQRAGGSNRASSYGTIGSIGGVSASKNGQNGFQFSMYTHRPDEKTSDTNQHASHLAAPTPVPLLRKKRSSNGLNSLSSATTPNFLPSSLAPKLTPSMAPMSSRQNATSSGRTTSMSTAFGSGRGATSSGAESYGESEPLRGGPTSRKASGSNSSSFGNYSHSSTSSSSTGTVGSLGGYYHTTPSNVRRPSASGSNSRAGTSLGNHGNQLYGDEGDSGAAADYTRHMNQAALIRTASKIDEIKKEVMAQTRKAVEQRLERERVLIEAEKKMK